MEIEVKYRPAHSLGVVRLGAGVDHRRSRRHGHHERSGAGLDDGACRRRRRSVRRSSEPF